jgi:hypothetical protein
VPYLDVNERAFRSSKGGVFAVTGAANPAPHGIGSKLIMKDAIEDVNFLAARMNMGIKDRIRSPPN